VDGGADGGTDGRPLSTTSDIDDLKKAAENIFGGDGGAARTVLEIALDVNTENQQSTGLTHLHSAAINAHVERLARKVNQSLFFASKHSLAVEISNHCDVLLVPFRAGPAARPPLLHFSRPPISALHWQLVPRSEIATTRPTNTSK